MRKLSKTIFTIIVSVILAITCLVSLVACNKKTEASINYVDYSKDNNYEVQTDSYLMNPEAEDFEQYSLQVSYPKDITPKYGLIFFVGTAIGPSFYDYLNTVLVKQGYVVIMPDVTLCMTYLNYEEETIPCVNKGKSLFPNVQFFVGGHSQGGGAAMRYAVENESSMLGAIFMSPLCYEEHEVTKNGQTVMQFDTLANSTLPTLLLEASNDNVLDDNMKADSLSRMPQVYEHHMITPGAHMSFSTGDSDDILAMFNGDGDGITQEQKDKQRADTLSYVLAFIKGKLPN